MIPPVAAILIVAVALTFVARRLGKYRIEQGTDGRVVHRGRHLQPRRVRAV